MYCTTRLLKAVTVKSIGVTAFFLICVSPFCVVFFKVHDNNDDNEYNDDYH